MSDNLNPKGQSQSLKKLLELTINECSVLLEPTEIQVFERVNEEIMPSALLDKINSGGLYYNKLRKFVKSILTKHKSIDKNDQVSLGFTLLSGLSNLQTVKLDDFIKSILIVARILGTEKALDFLIGLNQNAQSVIYQFLHLSGLNIDKPIHNERISVGKWIHYVEKLDGLSMETFCDTLLSNDIDLSKGVIVLKYDYIRLLEVNRTDFSENKVGVSVQLPFLILKSNYQRIALELNQSIQPLHQFEYFSDTVTYLIAVLLGYPIIREFSNSPVTTELKITSASFNELLKKGISKVGYVNKKIFDSIDFWIDSMANNSIQEKSFKLRQSLDSLTGTSSTYSCAIKMARLFYNESEYTNEILQKKHEFKTIADFLKLMGHKAAHNDFKKFKPDQSLLNQAQEVARQALIKEFEKVDKKFQKSAPWRTIDINHKYDTIKYHKLYCLI